MTEIRQLTLGELPQVAALAREIWYDCYPGIITQAQIAYMLEMMYAESVMRREATKDGIVYLGLRQQGELIGFAAFGPAPDHEVMLHKLYIDTAHQRRGHGSRLLETVLDTARQRRAGALILRVNRKNEQAVNAYRKNGFHIRAEDVAEIGNGFIMDDYIMARPLRG